MSVKKHKIDEIFKLNDHFEVEDFLATVFQHELDHLIGKLYVDRMKDITTLMFEDEMIFEELDEEVLD